MMMMKKTKGVIWEGFNGYMVEVKKRANLFY